MTSLRHLLILLAVLPQLLVLGLGGGVYICLDPGGDVHVQIAANSCCEGTSATSLGDAIQVSGPDGVDDCRSCRDVAIVADIVATPAPHEVAHEAGSLAVPVAVAGNGLDGWFRLPRRRMIVARDREPPTLLHLRSVVIRC